MSRPLLETEKVAVAANIHLENGEKIETLEDEYFKFDVDTKDTIVLKYSFERIENLRDVDVFVAVFATLTKNNEFIMEKGVDTGFRVPTVK